MLNKNDEVLDYEEHEIYIGYYYIPNNKNLIISKNGEVINLTTNNKLKNNIGEDGYVRTSCQIDDKIKSFKIHRLLAETFIGRPFRHLNKSFDELEVNHKDGDKTNYSLTNLEWVTRSENAIHAIAFGLTNHVKVLTKDIRTSEIIKYACINFCAEEYKINADGLRRHLKSKNNGTITKDWHVFKLDDGSPWPELNEKQYQENNWDVNYGVWCVTDIVTNMTYIFHSLNDAAKAYGFTNAAVNSFRLKYGENVPYKGYLFTYDHKPTAFTLKQLPVRAKNARSKGVPLIVTNLTTGEIYNYPSTYLACRSLPVTSGRIEFALKNRNGVVDNYKFEKTI